MSRNEKIYDGTCETVTSYNDIGEFDILGQHANFISLIKKYVILDKGGKNELNTNIDTGVLTCKNDQVEIYVQSVIE